MKNAEVFWEIVLELYTFFRVGPFKLTGEIVLN